jgi:hypothetical protein
LIHNKKTIVLYKRHRHATEKSEAHCISKELPVILVNKVVDPKKNNRKKWRVEEEERHKGSLTAKKFGQKLWIKPKFLNFKFVFMTLHGFKIH